MSALRAPTLITPTAPDYWECRQVDGATDVLGAAYFTDPAGLTDLEVAGVVDNAVSAVATWHGLAEDPQVPTPPWKQLLSPHSFSGWKLHIACASFADVRDALSRVFATCFRAGLGCKAATAVKPLAETGKGVVVYLPRRDTVDRDTSLVADALGDYKPSRPVEIPGDEHVTGALWWRHEFGGRDPGYDVFDPREYRSLYVRAGVGVAAA